MKRRSGEAVAAQHRKAGPMRHRLQPRGGATNPNYEDEDTMNPSKIIAEAKFTFPGLLTVKGELRDYGDGEVTASATLRFEGDQWRLDVDLDTDRDVVVSRAWYRGPNGNDVRATENEVQCGVDAEHVRAVEKVVCAMVGMAFGVAE